MAETPTTIDRRALIRRGVVAGAVAWTAPVIVGSIASPAAAATGAHGCNRIQMSGANCAPMAADANCLPAGWGTCGTTLNSACITSTTGPTCTGAGVSEVFVITGGCQCTFTAASSRFAVPVVGNQCNGFAGAGNPTVTPTTVTFPALGVSTYTQFKFVLTCA